MSEAQERQEASFDPTGHASPGQQLRRERERQGLGLEEVAVQLNLRPAVVAGLEEDRYEEVPVPAYRRGYLRAYARLMGIDERPIVEAYNSQYGRSDVDRKVTPVNVTKPPSKVGAWVFKLVTLLVILGLIGLTLLWWQSRNGNDLMDGLGLSDSDTVDMASTEDETITDDSTPNSPPSADTDTDTTLPPLPEDGAELGLVENDAATPDTAPQEQAGDSEASMIEPQGAPTAAEESESLEAGTTEEDPVSDSEPVGSASGTVETETTPEQEEAAPAAAAAASNLLELSFNEQSWTEVYDANGQRVLVGLQSAGTQATVEGDPPFRLTIGNASGVELRYRGEPVDLRARAGGNNVARFTLGE